MWNLFNFDPFYCSCPLSVRISCTLIMTNRVIVCKPMLIIVQFSSSKAWYVGDCVVFVIVENLLWLLCILL